MAKKNLLNAEGLASVWSQNPATPTKPIASKKSSAKVSPPPVKKEKPQAEVVETARSAKPKSPPHKKPKAKKTSVPSSGPQTISVSLDDLKKKKPEFTSYRIRKDLYYKLKEIAKSQGINQTGKMIERILESFCEHHDSQQA
ncbi:MAG: hypothetical protein AAFN10_04340 [Bacteroidota bacterium]